MEEILVTYPKGYMFSVVRGVLAIAEMDFPPAAIGHPVLSLSRRLAMVTYKFDDATVADQFMNSVNAAKTPVRAKRVKI